MRPGGLGGNLYLLPRSKDVVRRLRPSIAAVARPSRAKLEDHRWEKYAHAIMLDVVDCTGFRLKDYFIRLPRPYTCPAHIGRPEESLEHSGVEPRRIHRDTAQMQNVRLPWGGRNTPGMTQPKMSLHLALNGGIVWGNPDFCHCPPIS